MAVHVEDEALVKGGRVGTTGFMAPEVVNSEAGTFRTGKSVKASDVWSLGVILFTMLAGRLPFVGKTDDEVYALTRKGVYKWPTEPPVSAAAKDLVARMLTMDDAQRITAAEVHNLSGL